MARKGSRAQVNVRKEQKGIMVVATEMRQQNSMRSNFSGWVEVASVKQSQGSRGARER
jgi:hypothetical protein